MTNHHFRPIRIISTLLMGGVIATSTLLSASAATPSTAIAQGFSTSLAVGAVQRIHIGRLHTRLQVRESSGQVVSLRVLSTTMLLTGDGHPLPVTDVRPGDTLTKPGKQVLDASQRRSQLTGVIESAPYSVGDPLTLQVDAKHIIIVDLDRGVKVSGGARWGITQATLEDSDQIRVSGIVDSVIGEMTQTTGIQWLGPVQQPIK